MPTLDVRRKQGYRKRKEDLLSPLVSAKLNPAERYAYVCKWHPPHHPVPDNGIICWVCPDRTGYSPQANLTSRSNSLRWFWHNVMLDKQARAVHNV